MMRMCRCDGAGAVTDVCVRVSPARREPGAVRRLKRVSSIARVGQYMHRFGCFISRLGVHRFRTRRRTSCSTAAPAQPLAVFNGARRWRGRSLRLSAACLHAFGFSCSAAASLAESLTRAGKQTSYCNVAAHHQDATDTPARLEYSALACYARRNVVLLQPRSDRARAQIDRIQPRAALKESSGAFCFRLATFAWFALRPRPAWSCRIQAL